MKKLFISQPMRGKTDAEIQAEREHAIRLVTERLNEPVEPLDTLFTTDLGHPLNYLAESIKILANADIACFTPGWDSARGCIIEHECAERYDVPTLIFL